jgi:hypothetical protein
MKNIVLILLLSTLFLACKKDSNIEKLNYKITATSSFEQDKQALSSLFEKIIAISKSKTCTNSNDWLWTAYGDKPCGGPWGYIAYHKDINKTDFFYKIEYYFKLESEFNAKHGMFSTCDISPSPSSVSCINGEAVLNY